jgi:tetratricopeptide (TPR) repeat protein
MFFAPESEVRTFSPMEGLAMRTTPRTLPAAFAVLVPLVITPPLLAQNTEVAAVKRVIRAETESYYRHDADAWKATWVQDSTAIRTGVNSGGFAVDLGWDKFGPQTVDALKQDPRPQVIDLQTSNFVVRTDGGLAWAEYSQRIRTPTDSVPYVSREQRTLVKRDGDWKILSAGTYDSSSYGSSPSAVEQRLGSLASDLSDAKNHHDALEILKLSTQLYPGSTRTHRLLGNAYAATGDTTRAIRSYEKSLALNPKNDLSKAALAKLRAGKSP